MQLLSVSKLSKTIGDRTLFKDVDFGISEGEKLAIVGVNGSGKSTMLRILTEKEESDTGEIVKNRELKTSILAQNFHSDPEKTVREHIFRGEGKTILLLKKYSDICERMAEGDVNAEKEYNAILTEMDKVSAWEYETQVESILRELGIDHLNMKMSDLSGGMLKKVELASALIEESNLLILDEPTNHLDVQSILWLEDFLVQTEKALILITHDRYFLDRITDKILEIDLGKCFLYQGNYSYFLEKKAEREEKERIQEEKAEKFLRKEIEWLRRQPKARTTKQKARIDRADAVINREKIEIQKELELSVAAKRQGKTIMEVKNIKKSFGEKTVIENFTYHFKKQERLGIVGANGAGKSTLLNILAGRMNPDGGFINPGLNTVTGYFDQTSRDLPEEMRVLDYIKKNTGEYITTEDGVKITASKMLEKFLFDDRMKYSEIKKLSGGERRRLYLVQILMNSPNFLILDEPTNDLDIRTLSVLEDFLIGFPGTIVIVSHDRYFLDRTAETLLIFTGNGKIESYTGTYTSFLENPTLNKKEEKIIKTDIQEETPKEPVKKRSFKEEKELKNLEEQILQLEMTKEDIEKELAENSADYKRVDELSKRLQDIEKDIEKTWGRMSAL